MNNNNIVLRRLLDNDAEYRILEKWYQEKEIYSHFEQRKLTYNEIKDKYLPRTLNNTLIPVFMIEYNNQPIGIIQYQLINEDNKKLYNINSNKCYEIDIFIGELELHNKGLGKRSINLLSKYLFDKKKADMLVMCPLKNNISAIRCYENCGFKILNDFKAEDTIGNIENFICMIRKK